MSLEARKNTDKATVCNVETKLHRGEVVAPSLEGDDRSDRLLALSTEKKRARFTAERNPK